MKYAILAGDYRQYKLWCDNNPDHANESFFVSDITKVLGKIGLKLVSVGTWYERYKPEELRRIREYVETHQA